MDAVVQPDRSVTIKGRQTYQLVTAHPHQLAHIKTKRHWAAVLPRDCQPHDCGTEVTGLTFEKPITAQGARFAVALFEGEGTITEEPQGAFRLGHQGRQYVVLCGDRDAVFENQPIIASGRLAVIRLVEGRPDRVWIVDGNKLTIGDRNLIEADRPVTKEIVIEK